MAKPFVVRVGDLLREPGSRRDIDRVVEAESLATSAAGTIPGTPLEVRGAAVAHSGGVEVVGVVEFDWYGPCRRCLDDVTGHLSVDFREVCQRDPVDDEVLPIEGDLLDLEPLVRELVLASLPLAPLCRPDCPGPDPERFPTQAEAEVEEDVRDEGPPPDPRWAALGELRFD